MAGGRTSSSGAARSLLEQLLDWGFPEPAHAVTVELGLAQRSALLRAAGIERNEPRARGRVLVELLRRASLSAQRLSRAAPDFVDKRQWIQRTADLLRELSVLTDRWAEHGGPPRKGRENEFREPERAC